MGFSSVMGEALFLCVYKAFTPFCGCGKRGVNARAY